MISFLKLSSQVVRPGLCTGCGACQGMCPYWVSYHGRTIENYECNQKEGRCSRFCPRMPTDLAALREQFFDPADDIPQLGPVKGLYLVRAAAPAENAQHGGVVTALVQLALKEGLLDGAVLTRSQGGLDPEGVLVTTPEEVAACAGSSFQIPPTLAALNKALIAGEKQSIGVVGTPCKTLAAYKMKADESGCGKAIGLVFGLFCGWGLDWEKLAALTAETADAATLRHMDIPPSQYHRMDLTDAAGSHAVDLDKVLPLVRDTCRYCADMTAEFADISVGGGRSGDGWDTDRGWNQLIVRTRAGQQLLELARAQGVLEFKDLPEGALDKLKKASAGKKQKAMAALTQRFGSLGYLEPDRKQLEEATK